MSGLGSIEGLEARPVPGDPRTIEVTRDGVAAYRVHASARHRGDGGMVASVRDVAARSYTWIDGQGRAVVPGRGRSAGAEWAWLLDLAVEAGLVLDDIGASLEAPGTGQAPVPYADNVSPG